MKKKVSLPINASPAGAPTTEQQTALAVVGAGKLSIVQPGKLTDADLGRALTVHYHRATGGMTEVLRFGALLMRIQEFCVSALEHANLGNDARRDTGLKAWLAEHAPEINRTTAYRFLHVAEAVAADFKLPEKVSFIDLAISDASDLPETLQAKQTELWDFVSGTSQRSWLDRFAPAEKKTSSGEKTLKPLPKLTDEEIEKKIRQEVVEIYDAVYRSFGKKTWHYLPDQLIKGSIDMFEEFITEAKAHLAVPKRDRVALKIKASLTDK